MTDAPLLAGIDVGTTGTRCVVFDLTGRRVGAAYETYGVSQPGPDRVEQSVPEIVTATMEVCRRAVAESRAAGEVVAVAASTQMSTTCPVDVDGEPLRPLISWEDARADEQAAWIASRLSPASFKAITGTPLVPQLVGPTMRWLRQHEPAVTARAAIWPQLQGTVLRALGADAFYLDEPEAFAYGLWDVAERRWSEPLLDLMQVDPASLGSVVPPGTAVGTISPTAAERTGLPAGTAICVAAGDQMCAMVGMGATAVGRATCTLGTSGALEVTVPEPRTDVQGVRTVNHAVADRWILFAATLAAASAYRWLRDEVLASGANGEVMSYDALDHLAATAPPGAHGVLFLPYLNAAGTPHWNGRASGTLLGLTQHTVQADVVRAVMEGVTHEVVDSLRVLERDGLGPDLVRAGGGAARSDLWCQIQADAFGLPVQRVHEPEAAALGAAVLAAVGTGRFASVDEATTAMVHVSDTLDPDPTGQARHLEVHEAYDAAYDALADGVFDRLAALRRPLGATPELG